MEDKNQVKRWSMIWMHGLGSNAEDMMSVSDLLGSSFADVSLEHRCLNAPVRSVTLNRGLQMRAWYDILGVKFEDREDVEGISASARYIQSIIADEISKGIPQNQIILAGFSQGGAMALYSALHTPFALGGVVALSAYLPLAQKCQLQLPKTTPFFIGWGVQDDMVLPEWTQKAVAHVHEWGYQDLMLK